MRHGTGLRLFAALVVIGSAAVAVADIIKNPMMMAINLGSEAPAWSWKAPAHAEGDYDADGVFNLSGNGHAIYMCWDRAAFAFVVEAELKGDFVLQGRFKEIPTTGPGCVSMTVKASTATAAPVLDLRWDYYWQDRHPDGVGLSWFNRQTQSSRIGLQDDGERGDCLGNAGSRVCPGWEGCLGYGYENRVPGFTSRDDLWLAVKRVGCEKYFLFAKYGNRPDWTRVGTRSAGSTQIRADTAAGDSIGQAFGPTELFYFEVPEVQDGLAFAGFSVVGVGYGANDMWARIDNIEVRTGADADSSFVKFIPADYLTPMATCGTLPPQSDPPGPLSESRKTGSTAVHPPGARPMSRAAGVWSAVPLGSGVRLTASDWVHVASVGLHTALGRAIDGLALRGDAAGRQFTLTCDGALRSGIYWISVRSANGTSAVVPLVVR